ncbi:angiopoietin-related protein 7-like [Pomacea canaliculata]|uniref:angiopoietin-related protein 7-like n=1 Tax=Pomacea canaliculata TaxID=400727 RepID=UPI000D726211|nr:angiopoietin-related protein 7-like [Pomacea canaliculata]
MKTNSCVLWDLMMLCWLVKTLTIVVLVAGSNAVLWSSSPHSILACDGHEVTIPWSFTLIPNETVISITWFVERNDGTKNLFSSLTEGEFFSPSRQHVQFVPNAGLRLQNVTDSDTGVYSVHVSTLDGAGHVTISNRSAAVQVTAPPVLSGGQFLARHRSAPEKDDVTGVWHVILECGQFTDRGRPPVTVQWRTPSGAVYTDVNYQDGYFYLPLQAVELGNYTCSASDESLAGGCLGTDSELLGEATVSVDQNVKLAVMEANQNELIREGQILRQENQELKSQVQNLTQRLNQLASYHQATCLDIRNRGDVSGVYTLYQGNSTITAYCDQDTDGGGWTVFQRRQDGSVDFFRNWTDYRNGFGDLNGEFWLGLDNLHTLTSLRHYELRVDLEAFNGTRAFAGYRGFRIGDVGTNYTLYFDDFLGGNAGDSLTYHKGHGFMTKDYGDSHRCAGDYHGAWWYDNCFDSNLNGIYIPTGVSPTYDGIKWSSFTNVSLKRTEMKIRPM